MITATGSYFPADQDADIVTFADRPLSIQRDGSEIVRVETSAGPDDDPNEQPFGSPGVSLELTPEQAVELAFAILAQADSTIVDGLINGLDRARDDLDYASKAEGNYDADDMPGIERDLKLWGWINERLVAARTPTTPAPRLRLVKPE